MGGWVGVGGGKGGVASVVVRDVVFLVAGVVERREAAEVLPPGVVVVGVVVRVVSAGVVVGVVVGVLAGGAVRRGAGLARGAGFFFPVDARAGPSFPLSVWYSVK